VVICCAGSGPRLTVIVMDAPGSACVPAASVCPITIPASVSLYFVTVETLNCDKSSFACSSDL
jgi:hypothetical protein